LNDEDEHDVKNAPLIRDPLIDRAEPVTLSSRTPLILAVRCIGKQTPAQ